LKKDKWKKTPWQRIVKASENGRGIRLTFNDVLALTSDEAIVTKALNDDYEEETGDPGGCCR
jgi:hypothetical protein